MMRDVAIAAIGLGLVVMLAQPASASPSNADIARLDPKKALEVSEQAVGRTIGDFQLVDSTGAPLALRTFRGKPLVISLVYTSCSSVCPLATQHLIDAVVEANRVIGAGRYNVVTVGFDARHDTPRRLTQFALAQGIKFGNWRLASADVTIIKALLRDLGFSYTSIAGGFNHLTQTTIIDSTGKIYRQVYGDDFPLQMFMEPMKDVVYGTSSHYSVSGIFNRLKFICTVYDPSSGAYRIDYGMITGSILGALSLLGFGVLIYREWIRTRHA